MWRSDFLNIKPKYFLIAILLLGAFLRFWGLNSAEIFHDEGFYAFRSIGYFDYIQNDTQTTPVQWFKDSILPWWTYLSFHDAPPLFFLIQKFFFKIFGDSLLVARLPSAIVGIASIYLVYLISTSIFRKPGFYRTHIGLFAALLLSVNHVHIWISRSSLMESLQIFLILLNIYYFFVFLDSSKKWKMFGLTLGLVFLTKYTGMFLAPVYLIYLLAFRRDVLKKKEWWLASGIVLLVFSPVIIYNIQLYRAVGHFDLQFAYLFGQETPEWRASLGKIQEPFSNIFENLLAMYSIPFLLATLAGIGYASYNSIRLLILRKPDLFIWRSDFQIFWPLNLILITLILVLMGSAFRFITLYLPPFIFFVSLATHFFSEKLPQKIFLSVLGIFLAYESYFAIGGIFLEFPDFGVVKIDNYLEETIGGQRSLRLPQSPNPHLDAVIKRYGSQRPLAEKSLVIVYDENIALSSKLWLFTRRLYYHGILTVTAGQFKNLLQIQSDDAFKNSRVYFVKATENTSLNPNFSTKDAAELEYFLQSRFSSDPEKMIYGQNDLLMFKIYKFLL